MLILGETRCVDPSNRRVRTKLPASAAICQCANVGHHGRPTCFRVSVSHFVNAPATTSFCLFLSAPPSNPSPPVWGFRARALFSIIALHREIFQNKCDPAPELFGLGLINLLID